MKKYLLVGLIVFFTNNLVAQNKEIIGDWKENYRTVADTLSSAVDIINSDPQAYRKGLKKLSSEYIDYREVYPESDAERRKISITKDLDVFWFAYYGSDFVKKITYAPETNNYMITKGDFTNSDLAIIYDEKNQKLLFIDEESGITRYEFSRK
jgi:hypothetical protein